MNFYILNVQKFSLELKESIHMSTSLTILKIFNRKIVTGRRKNIWT